MIRSQRFVLSVIIFFACIFTLSAKTVKEGVKPVQTITFSVGRAFSKGVEKGTTPIAGFYTYDRTKFGIYGGLQGTNDIFDLMTGVTWWPFVFRPHQGIIKFGFEARYHYMYYTNISNEHDILGGLALSLKTKNNFMLYLNTLYMEKISTVFAVQAYVPYYNDHSMGLYLSLDKMWKSGFEMYATGATYDSFRYPLFCSPSFTMGLGYTSKKK